MRWQKISHGNKIKAIVNLYKDGVSIAKIAQVYQVDRTAIRYHLKKLGYYKKNI